MNFATALVALSSNLQHAANIAEQNTYQDHDLLYADDDLNEQALETGMDINILQQLAKESLLLAGLLHLQQSEHGPYN